MSPDERRPKLEKWFNIDKRPAKTIALWPCAGYGAENKRNPSKEWYGKLVEMLVREGMSVIQFGHPRDFSIGGVTDLREMAFFDQIKATLGCDLTISTDSGSGLIFGAYGANQISLLTNHFPYHTQNLTAFGPDNPNNINFVGMGSADRIDLNDVVNSALIKIDNPEQVV